MEDESDLRRPFDDLADDRFLLGTHAEVYKQIERIQERLDPAMSSAGYSGPVSRTNEPESASN